MLPNSIISKRTKIIFYLLVTYIICQFLWWEILLVKQSNELIYATQNFNALTSPDNTNIIEELNNKKNYQLFMVVGEGTIFLILLLIGIRYVYLSIKKRIELTLQQNNFLLSISHELKTPIASAKLQVQTLQKHAVTNEQKIELLSNTLLELDRLNTLVNNVLLVTVIENKKSDIFFENINLSALVNDTCNRYYSTYIDNSWLKLDIQNQVYIKGESELLISVITNLVENAIKYSFDKLDVVITLVKKNNLVFLIVKDSGIGIIKEDKPYIFDKFFRNGHEMIRKTKGTGIGLYIVQQICNKHYANIDVTSIHQKGSTFTVTFNVESSA